MSFAQFTTRQWATVTAARDDWPVGIDWAAVRAELEQAGRDFHTMRARRLRQPPAVPERARLRKLLRYATALKSGLPDIALDADPDWHRRAVAELAQIERVLDAWLWQVRGWASPKGFGGHNDAHRDLLQGRALALWTGTLGGKLEFSRDDNNSAVGPLIRYLRAVLRPILGEETPGPAGLAAIVVKERERRKWCAEQAAKREQQKG
jgi:hypothetical protein